MYLSNPNCFGTRSFERPLERGDQEQAGGERHKEAPNPLSHQTQAASLVGQLPLPFPSLKNVDLRVPPV